MRHGRIGTRTEGAVSLVQLSMVGLMVRDMAASLAFYRRLGLDIPQGSEEKAFVQMRMESGVSIFWDTVFADKYDPDRAYTRDPGGPPDQQPGTTPTGG